MKKFLMTTTFMCITITTKIYAQTTNSTYLKMTVNNDILDCPHFSMIMDNIISQKFSGKLIQKQPKEKFIVYSLANANENSVKIFRAALDSIHFPSSSIKEIIIEQK